MWTSFSPSQTFFSHVSVAWPDFFFLLVSSRSHCKKKVSCPLVLGVSAASFGQPPAASYERALVCVGRDSSSFPPFYAEEDVNCFCCLAC